MLANFQFTIEVYPFKVDVLADVLVVDLVVVVVLGVEVVLAVDDDAAELDDALTELEDPAELALEGVVVTGELPLGELDDPAELAFDDAGDDVESFAPFLRSSGSWRGSSKLRLWVIPKDSF